jgi:hypothetical protein
VDCVSLLAIPTTRDLEGDCHIQTAYSKAIDLFVEHDLSQALHI